MILPSGGGPLYPLGGARAGSALAETQSAKRMNVTTILDDCSHSIDTLAGVYFISKVYQYANITVFTSATLHLKVQMQIFVPKQLKYGIQIHTCDLFLGHQLYFRV